MTAHMKRTAAAQVVTSRVSSNVLQMQFMKRSRVIADAKQQQKKDVKEPLKRSKVTPSAQKIEDAPLVDLDGTVYDSRFPQMQDLRYGRFSFNGQNPDIEKLSKTLENRRLGIEEEEEGEILEIEQKPGPAEEAPASSFARTGFHRQRQEEMRPLQISYVNEHTESLSTAGSAHKPAKQQSFGTKRKSGGQAYGKGGGPGNSKRGRQS